MVAESQDNKIDWIQELELRLDKNLRLNNNEVYSDEQKLLKMLIDL